MEKVNLKATARELLGKKVKILRQQGQIPAVVYGKKFEPISILLDRKEFLTVAKTAGEATIINLEIGGKETVNTLMRKIQRHPVSDEIIHVDLYKIDMSQEIETEIPLEFEGVSPAVEDLEGNLITNKDSIHVKCKPDKLVSQIVVKLENLKTFDDLIHVKDLAIPEGIEVLDETEDVIAQVTPPRSEEELEAMEEESKAAAETEKEHIEGMEKEAEAEKAAKETTEGTEESAEQKPAQEEKKE